MDCSHYCRTLSQLSMDAGDAWSVYAPRARNAPSDGGLTRVNSAAHSYLADNNSSSSSSSSSSREEERGERGSNYEDEFEMAEPEKKKSNKRRGAPRKAKQVKPSGTKKTPTNKAKSSDGKETKAK